MTVAPVDRSDASGGGTWGKMKSGDAPRPSATTASTVRGDFTLRGHRLPSLYRVIRVSALRLMGDYRAASSCQKYPNWPDTRARRSMQAGRAVTAAPRTQTPHGRTP